MRGPSNAEKAFSKNTLRLLSSIIICDEIRLNGNVVQVHAHPFLDSTNESLNITDVLITRRGIEQHFHTFKLPIHQRRSRCFQALNETMTFNDNQTTPPGATRDLQFQGPAAFPRL